MARPTDPATAVQIFSTVSDDFLLTPETVSSILGFRDIDRLSKMRARNDRGLGWVKVGKRSVRYPAGALRKYLAGLAVQGE